MDASVGGQPAAGAASGGVTLDSVNTAAATRPAVQVLPLVGSAACFTLAGAAFVWLRRRPGSDDPDLNRV